MFITQDDFTQIIRLAHLDEILHDHPAALQEAIHTALHEMAAYLSSRYDVQAIYDQAGPHRHPLILLLGMDITLYHLHARIDPVQMPDIRRERYERAIQILSDIADGRLAPLDLPSLQDPDGSPETGNRYGADKPFISKF